MKAHTSEKRDIILSIGMIVKNEEKVLERCLRSMQPIMEAIPCELIIADTGSTDSTVEIAKKYTDNVFHFEWINDFAAARNSTLDKAKGQWYMFIDADEYFDEDISEMIHFFNIPELRSKYKTLEITVRSYSDKEKSVYSDGTLARFHRIDGKGENIRFIGKIHEAIPIRSPFANFSTIIHHTGYCYLSKEEANKKRERNVPLMIELHRNNPNDLRMLSHIISGLKNGTFEQEEFVIKALDIARKKRENLYANAVFVQAIIHYKDKDPYYALSLCDEYESTLKKADEYAASVAVYLMKFKILSALTKNEEAYNAFEHYMQLYKDFKSEKLNTIDCSARPVEGITENEFISSNCTAALVLMKLQRYNESLALLDQFDINTVEPQNFKNILGTIREICQDMKNYSGLAHYYENIIKSDDENKKSLALYMMESTYYSIVGENSRIGYAKDVVESGAKGRYCDLMNLILNQDDDSFIDNLARFIEEVDNWKDGYSEAIYLAVKHGIDISDVVDRMNSEAFREKLEMIAVNHDDFASYVLNYGVPENYTMTIKRFLWITSLYEKASYRSFTLDDSRKYEIYTRFTTLLGEYVSNIYNPELLEDEADVEVLLPLHRFGFYMLKANNALANGEKIEYIRELRKALVNCESMKEIVQFLMEQFKKREM